MLAPVLNLLIFVSTFILELSFASDLNKHLTNPHLQNAQKKDSRPNKRVFTIEYLEPCKETKSITSFERAIIDCRLDLTKLNDLLHCPNANALIRGLNRNMLEYIASRILSEGKIPSAFKEAFDIKLKEFPRGARWSGRREIFLQCRSHFDNIVIALKEGRLNNICINRLCSKDDMDYLKKKFLESIDGNKPSDCAHYSMKGQVIELLNSIKETRMAASDSIGIEELTEILSDVHKQPNPENLHPQLNKLRSFKMLTGLGERETEDDKGGIIRENIEYLIKTCERLGTYTAQTVNEQLQLIL
jgi:hypothetical protein